MQARMPWAAASADWAIRSTSPGLFSHLHAGSLSKPVQVVEECCRC